MFDSWTIIAKSEDWKRVFDGVEFLKPNRKYKFILHNINGTPHFIKEYFLILIGVRFKNSKVHRTFEPYE